MSAPPLLDLAPAKWIWFPSRRTLANTFVLFRREVELDQAPTAAKGWIVADSRYRLTVNGKRVQWGPAPHDPRHAEADPVDLRPYLQKGKNVIGVEVLFYSHGEGTWPFGKPGLLAKLEIDGKSVITDSHWNCLVDRAHRPGQYRRWFLRALQEDFDSRLHPFGWDQVGFDDRQWLPAQEFNNPANRSAYASGYADYANENWYVHPEESTLTERSIPLLHETEVSAELTHAHRLNWRRDPQDWFELRTPGCFEIQPTSVTDKVQTQASDQGFALIYRLPEGMVGWPYFVIEAPAGTVVELMPQETHDPAKTAWLDTHYYAWSRFVCREGVHRYETFDFEALRWLQLHIHGNSREVKVHEVGVRRRVFPWPNQPRVTIADPQLQRLFDASLNTLSNSAQETCVDGMGRERQQYSGDGGHQLNAVRMAFGEWRLPARFLRTFAYGQFLDGVFADSWPAYDRLARLWERNVESSGWGPLIDHSVGFCFDHYRHWMQSGDVEPAKDNWARLQKFAIALEKMIQPDGLLPVEDLGMNAVWIDHEAFRQQRHKRLAFNLYVAAMLQHALAPLAEAVDPGSAKRYRSFGAEIQRHAFKQYWDEKRKLLINNRPFGEKEAWCDDRSLATAVLFGMLKDPRPAVELLAKPTKELGTSYPANAIWRYWALIHAGCIQPVLDDLRARWATMRSVSENNSLQEFWQLEPDTAQIASHCPLSPLIVLFEGVMGLQPLKPGFEELQLRPQLGDLADLDVTAYTPHGPVRMQADSKQIRYQLPDGIRRVEIFGRSEINLGPAREIVLNR